MDKFAITLYLVVYLSTLINGNTVDNPTGRILHGKEVTSCKTYPWHAQLYFEETFSCGGTLISDKFVLTAAHCSIGMVYDTMQCAVGSNYDVYLGSTKRKEGIKYEGFLKACIDNYINMEYDVALVELTKSVTRTNCIDYLSILDVEGPIMEDLPVTAIGFGITENVDYPKNLYATNSLRTVNINICEKIFNETFGTIGPFSTHICTSSSLFDGQNTCKGDSGGSLFYKENGGEPVLLGITSFGLSKTCLDGFTIYPKVNDPVIYHWIKNMTKYN